MLRIKIARPSQVQVEALDSARRLPCLLLLLLFLSPWPSTAQAPDVTIPPDEKPVQLPAPQIQAALVETSRFIRVVEARNDFSVSGQGLAVAVLDTGLRTTHVDFTGRVPAQRNFTEDDGGDPARVTDVFGHGTNVAGIIVANGLHRGIAPGAKVIPLKVLNNQGGGSFDAIDDALQWVLDNQRVHNITVVNLSLGDRLNHISDASFAGNGIRSKIRQLRTAGVAVVVAAGNDYFRFPIQGMSFPAILRETVSVGAVYDANIGGPIEYASGARANTTGEGRITPFSQRLHPTSDVASFTDIFSPGAPVTSTGIQNDRGESVQQGTSQAAPVTAGVILLMQELYLRAKGRLPSVDELEEWLLQGAVPIHDGDDENDNVVHTNLEFQRLDALTALQAVQRGLTRELLETSGVLTPGGQR